MKITELAPRVADDGIPQPLPPNDDKKPTKYTDLVWVPSPGFPDGRAYDTQHEGTTWRIALVLHEEPVGMPWIDDEAVDGWRLYKADGGRMQPIASPMRGLDYVRSHAALRICPRRVHR